MYAINLAQKEGMDVRILFCRDHPLVFCSSLLTVNLQVPQQNVIFRKYGDFLYQKQDYDSAMQQYLKAIDNTEPSQVIRKVKHEIPHNF